MFYNNSSQDNTINESFADCDDQALIEAFIADEIACQPDEVKQEFINSEEAAVMEAKGLINRKTLVRLNKNDDISRRETMAAMYLAKQKKDALWTKLAQNRVKERALLAQIKKKYGAQAKNLAKKSQRDYLHKMPARFVRKAELAAGRDKG